MPMSSAENSVKSSSVAGNSPIDSVDWLHDLPNDPGVLVVDVPARDAYVVVELLGDEHAKKYALFVGRMRSAPWRSSRTRSPGPRPGSGSQGRLSLPYDGRDPAAIRADKSGDLDRRQEWVYRRIVRG